MRKFISAIDNYGTVPSLSPSPSPSPSPLQYENLNRGPLYYFPSIPAIESAFDFATVSAISGILLISLLSLSFIFHLRLKSRRSHHLQNFNILWTVRFLLITFVSLWALNETMRLPFFRRHYLYPFLPPLTLSQQSDLCKIHVVLSLGLFEPGFLLTLLFLVDVSVQQKNLHQIWSISSVFVMCCPTLILQTFFVFLSPLKAQLPLIFHRDSVVFKDEFGNKTVMCTYPVFSSIVFAAFAIVYTLGLFLSCWRVISLVINKGTRIRINVLAFTVMVALLLQILFLGMSSYWSPENPANGGVLLAMFVSVAICAAVGEFILVIKPIVDALKAGGDCWWWDPGVRLRPPESDSERTGDRSQ